MDANDIRAAVPPAEAVAFCKAIQTGDYNAAGVFADWLTEQGDPRGVLLRRRWKRWQKESQEEHAHAQILADAMVRPFRDALAAMKVLGAEVAVGVAEATVRTTGLCNDRFLRYLREKFSQEMYEASDPTNSQAYKDG